MNSKIKLNNKGFSLMELLVCLAISAMVILAAYSLVLVGTKSYDNNSKSTTIQKEVSFTTGILAETVRNADIKNTIIKKYDSSSSGHEGDIEIHTDERVIYYDKDAKTIRIYEDSTTPKTVGSYTDTDSKYTVSKYVTSFDAKYVSGPDDDMSYEAADGLKAYSEDSSDPAAVTKYGAIEFTMNFEYKNKSDSTKVVYQMRKSS